MFGVDSGLGWGLVAQEQLLLEARVRWNTVDTQHGVLRAFISQPSCASNNLEHPKASWMRNLSIFIDRAHWKWWSRQETGPTQDSLAIMSLTMACLFGRASTRSLLEPGSAVEVAWQTRRRSPPATLFGSGLSSA